MSRPATSRLKVNPPLGHMPALQYLLPDQLKIDPAYQRSLELAASQALIRKIAMYWNWDLCQPLVVARRDNGDLYVIDGQHRLEAARLRGDIHQLPAVVVLYATPADEAASFVHLNQQRRPLSKLDVFKAAVASEDPEASAIAVALGAVGLSIAPHTNFTAWKPGMLANIGGIEAAWRRFGPATTKLALRVLAQAFAGEQLRYAGTVFPGIVAVCANEPALDGKRLLALATLVQSEGQSGWRARILREKADQPNLRFNEAAASVMLKAWTRAQEQPSEPVPERNDAPAADKRGAAPIVAPDGKRWCSQCDRRVHTREAALCTSRFCRLRPRIGK